nr:DUF3810 family protein [Caldalkalibacillus mannanilyticus]
MTFKRTYLAVLLPLTFVLSYLASLSPSLVEELYTKSLFSWFAPKLSRMTGVVPFSLFEWIVVFLLLFIAGNLGMVIVQMLRRPQQRKQIVMKQLSFVVVFVSLLCFSFMTMWGLNYHRTSVSTIAQLEAKAVTIEELATLSHFLVDRANELREHVDEDAQGITKSPNGIEDIFVRADKGYQIASSTYQSWEESTADLRE